MVSSWTEQWSHAENVATNPEIGFVIAPEDYAKAEELSTIECVYHAHINSNEKFSAHDISVLTKQSALVALQHKHWRFPLRRSKRQRSLLRA